MAINGYVDMEEQDTFDLFDFETMMKEKALMEYMDKWM